MIEHKVHKVSKFTPEQLYNLVIDINSYPEFLPWCSASRIKEEYDDHLIADLVISFTGFREKYTSKVYKSSLNSENNCASVRVELIEGPFKHLHNYWEFRSVNNQTEIYFEIAFSFNSTILEKIMSLVFEKALLKMVSAFEQRAEKIYIK